MKKVIGILCLLLMSCTPPSSHDVHYYTELEKNFSRQFEGKTIKEIRGIRGQSAYDIRIILDDDVSIDITQKKNNMKVIINKGEKSDSR